jgi:hypothetical protein
MRRNVQPATFRFLHEDSAPISFAAAALALEAAGDSQELKPYTNLFTPSLWAIGADLLFGEPRELYLVPPDFLPAQYRYRHLHAVLTFYLTQIMSRSCSACDGTASYRWTDLS